MSTQIQRRRGTTAEHSTFTGVEGELTIDTTKDTAVVHDGTTVGGHPLQKQYPALGSASTPTYTFTGDTNTGIYSPGADQVAISTNGQGRLYINSAGQIGIGTPNQSQPLQIYTGSSDSAIRLQTNSGTEENAYIALRNSGGNLDLFSVNGAITLNPGNTEKLRITSAGLVGVGTSDPTSGTSSYYDDLVVRNATSGTGAGITIQSNSTNGFSGLNLRKADGTDLGKLVTDSSDGKLYIETAGLAAITVDTSQRVGVGTTTPGYLTHLATGASATASLALDGGTDSGHGALLLFRQGGTSKWFIGTDSTINSGTSDDLDIYTSGARAFRIYTNNQERLRVTSSGNVGIGTSSPTTLFHVSGGRTTLSSSDGYELAFARTGNYFYWYNDGGNLSGKLSLTTSSGAGGGEIITFTQDTKRVGIGTTTAGANLDLAGTTSRIRWDVNNAYTLQTHGNVAFSAFASSIQNAADYQFQIAGSERARIDSSGRLLVGTSTALSVGEPANALFQVLGRAGGATDVGRLAIARGEAATSITSGEEIGKIYFTDNAGNTFGQIECTADANAGASDFPGRLVFSVTRDSQSSPTEALRITNGGETRIFCVTTAQGLIINHSDTARNVYAFYEGRYSATDNTGSTGTRSYIVYTSGDVRNVNNSYGAISDIKLKENIVDANSQWDDLKALQVRNYNFKEGQTHTQIGLVAQEVELVSPGLVSESPDRDAEGNDLGTVTKSVNYSVLYMKAVKALQEAMERIETLEAKVVALESA